MNRSESESPCKKALGLLAGNKLQSVEDIVDFAESLGLSDAGRRVLEAYVRLSEEKVNISLRRLAEKSGLNILEVGRTYRTEIRPLINAVERSGGSMLEIMPITDSLIVVEKERILLNKNKEFIMESLRSGKIRSYEDAIGTLQGRTRAPRKRVMRYLNKWGIKSRTFHAFQEQARKENK